MTGAGPSIVVGVDGSDGARLALRWAVAEARRWGALLVLVHAWQDVMAADFVASAVAAMESAAKQVLARAQREAEELGGDAVDARLERGGAADVLLRAAEDADLLVVGSRGRGGFSALLLGSTSQQCVQHASCPVVVVPGATSIAKQSS